MKKICLFITSLLLLSIFSFAQTDSLPTENWDTYLATFQKKPGSILLNMSLKSSAPQQAYPFLLVTGVKFTDCSREGFPSSREYKKLFLISDSVKAVVERTTGAVLCGTFTYQCQRLDYFYVQDTARLRLPLSGVYKNQLPDYEYYINIKADKGWNTYLDFLFPSDTIRDFMDNQKILMALERAGDKLLRSRPIEHFAYFKSEADRTCFSSFVLKKGFRITKKDNSGGAGAPLLLQFSRIDKPQVNIISRITIELRRQAAKCNGEYDAWETAVIR
ncbi:MAG: DUF695 domain-containing protein [Bacteroidetes bacterium]|nr:DUF695 domain-containing protein [Bacteroidota bacterium]